MSGVQGVGAPWLMLLNLLRNLRRPTTYRCHMPYVVAYVVPDVEGVRGRGNFRGAVLSKFRWVDQRIGRDAAS